jgi:hypothetical protein
MKCNQNIITYGRVQIKQNVKRNNMKLLSLSDIKYNLRCDQMLLQLLTGVEVHQIQTQQGVCL